MSYCPDSYEARVWFRFPGEDWDNVVSRNPPVNFSLEEVEGAPGQCSCVVYRVSYVQTNFSAPNNFTCNLVAGSSRTFDRRGPISIQLNVPVTIGSGGCAGRTGYRAVDIIHYGSASSACSPTPLVQRNNTGLTLANPIAGIQNISIIRLDGQPDNCSPPSCKFTVTDNGGILYTRTESECPEVQVQCSDECPPGFCKCTNPLNPNDWCCCPCQC